MRPTGTISLSNTTPEINPQPKPKQHSQVPSAAMPVMLEAQLHVQPRPTSLPAPQDLSRTEPLILAAVNGRHAGHVATLLDDLNPRNDKQFDQALEALRKAISINTQKLKIIFRTQLGLPNSAIKQIGSALEQCLDLPLDIIIKPCITARQVSEEIFMQTRLSLLCLLPKVLLGTLQSPGCLEELRNEIQLHGKVFEVFSASSISQLKQLCQKMQIAIDSGSIEIINFSRDDEPSEPVSESDSASEAQVGESSSEEATDPKSDASHS